MRYPNTGNLTIEENDNYKMTFYKKKKHYIKYNI